MIVADVLDGGMFTTVQDLGRVGYLRYGVPTSGAMDRAACLAANALVGNPPGAAILEITLVGPRIRFVAPATIALAGADLGARLDDRPISCWESLTVLPGQTLRFAGPADCARACLAVLGGIDVPVVLGSRSTYTRSRLGGADGRPLAQGDRLAIPGDAARVLAGRGRVPEAERPVYGSSHVLRVLRGPQDDRFTQEGLATFFSSDYTVTADGDRMGCRLQGPRIAHLSGADIVSDGSPPGAVQVSGDGQPIVLMADRGTAGGYAKIATVITVDVWRLAQAAPGDSVRFREATLAEAREALRAQREWLDRIRPTASVAPAVARGASRRRKAAAAAVAAVATALEDDSATAAPPTARGPRPRPA